MFRQRLITSLVLVPCLLALLFWASGIVLYTVFFAVLMVGAYEWHKLIPLKGGGFKHVLYSRLCSLHSSYELLPTKLDYVLHMDMGTNYCLHCYIPPRHLSLGNPTSYFCYGTISYMFIYFLYARNL